MNKFKFILGTLLLFILGGCSAYYNQPTQKQKARIGEEVFTNTYLDGITPVKPIVVGVYKFRDQTGQYKQVDNGVSYSTAVTQGATTILIKALEDTKWFIPIERENVSNLLNERQIIRSTRNENSKKNGKDSQPLPPLLFAGVILEGGIVSYDSNIITGGSGARYFGVGASTQYRQDRISVYLRAVSTSSGKILKTVYITKTILSQAIDVNLFKYVKLKRLLEIETGVSQNEPGQLAVKEAIEKAVESLIIEGLKGDIWAANEDQNVVNSIIFDYDKEKKIAAETQLFNRITQKQRRKNVLNAAYFVNHFNGDYNNSKYEYDGFQIGYKHYFKNPKFNFGGRVATFTLSTEPVFSDSYFTTDLNLEYTFLPKDRLTPYIYAGAGSLFKDFDKFHFKMHYGAGLEYLKGNNLGFRLFAEKNDLFTDKIDFKIHGKRDDSFLKIGIELNIYLGF